MLEIFRAEEAEGAGVADRLWVGIAQIAPVWLQKQKTLEKVVVCIEQAADAGVELIVFGEALVPGYPFWIERTDGARFNDPRQKAMYSHYVDQAVDIDAGDLKSVCDIAQRRGIAVYLGVMEKAADRGGHSVYCTLVYIDAQGRICSTHRKLQPTYEERLAWAQGDGHGLVVHDLGAFRVGGLNCYENWMPLARTALYAQGESLHVSVWPGGLHNTHDLPQFIAKESRSYVMAASGVLHVDDVPRETLMYDEIVADTGHLADGGSTIVGPDGGVLVSPVVGQEALLIASVDHAKVREERQNFDPVGHYSRPDVLQVAVNTQRQSVLRPIDRTH